MARLADQHGPSFLRDLAAELVAELTETTSTSEPQPGQTWFPDPPGPGAGDPRSP